MIMRPDAQGNIPADIIFHQHHLQEGTEAHKVTLLYLFGYQMILSCEASEGKSKSHAFKVLEISKYMAAALDKETLVWMCFE